MHLVEDGARGLVEVFVESRIVARTKTAECLDGRANGRAWIIYRWLWATRRATSRQWRRRDLLPRADVA